MTERPPLFDVATVLPLAPATPIAVTPTITPIVVKPLAELPEFWVFFFRAAQLDGIAPPGRRAARMLKYAGRACDLECLDHRLMTEAEIEELFRHRRKPR